MQKISEASESETFPSLEEQIEKEINIQSYMVDEGHIEILIY